jgi:HAD superfamily hydrolase (TIGR01509 family)
MIDNDFNFIGYELEEKFVFSLGTPFAVKKYINDTYIFLFDLDGTIVITDNIYFDVWYEILMTYNIVLTEYIFKTFIQGNNDKYVNNTLLANIDLNLDELSKLKDELFIKNISKIKINDGIYELLNEIRNNGYKVSIVTNCNRMVANEIVKYIHIEKYIDFIITNDDCINGKPDPEPYKKAISRYNTPNNKCIIFEDSKTGILSGKSVSPKLLVGIETIYNSLELKQIGVDLSIKNFVDLSIHALINTTIDITDCHIIYGIISGYFILEETKKMYFKNVNYNYSNDNKKFVFIIIIKADRRCIYDIENIYIKLINDLVNKDILIPNETLILFDGLYSSDINEFLKNYYDNFKDKY